MSTETAAFLREIGFPGHAGDVSSLRFAEAVIAAERARVAQWLRGEDRPGLARAVEAGEHARPPIGGMTRPGE